MEATVETTAEFLKRTMNFDFEVHKDSEGRINGAVFEEFHIPMIIYCTCCQMSMSIMSDSARVVHHEDGNYICCTSCL